MRLFELALWGRLLSPTEKVHPLRSDPIVSRPMYCASPDLDVSLEKGQAQGPKPPCQLLALPLRASVQRRELRSDFGKRATIS